MSIFDKFPYTNTHEINLDWVLSTMGECVAKVETAVEKIATLTANFLPAKKNTMGGYDVSDAVNLTGTAHAVKPDGSDTAEIVTVGYCEEQLDAAKDFTNVTVAAAENSIKEQTLPAGKSAGTNRYVVGVPTQFSNSPLVPSQVGDIGVGGVGRWSDSLKLLTTSMSGNVLNVNKQLSETVITFAEIAFDFGMTLNFRFWGAGSQENVFQTVVTLPTAGEVEILGNAFTLNLASLFDLSSGEQVRIRAECEIGAGNRLTRIQQITSGSFINVKMVAESEIFNGDAAYSTTLYTLKPF